MNAQVWALLKEMLFDAPTSGLGKLGIVIGLPYDSVLASEY